MPHPSRASAFTFACKSVALVIARLKVTAQVSLLGLSAIALYNGFKPGGATDDATLGNQIIWSVNSVGHRFGTRPHNTAEQSRNNGVVALLGFGEGWHNNHHQAPTAAALGHHGWQLDIARVPTDVNRLSNQVLVTTYEEEWGKVLR